MALEPKPFLPQVFASVQLLALNPITQFLTWDRSSINGIRSSK